MADVLGDELALDALDVFDLLDYGAHTMRGCALTARLVSRPSAGW